MSREIIGPTVLNLASDAITAREAAYGDPLAGMSTTARLWSVILRCNIEPYQVALCLDALKTSRLMVEPRSLDSWVDKCGYSAIGAEVAGVRLPPAPAPATPPERICARKDESPQSHCACGAELMVGEGMSVLCVLPRHHHGDHSNYSHDKVHEFWHKGPRGTFPGDFHTWPNQAGP